MTISFDRLRHLLLMVATVSILSALTTGCKNTLPPPAPITPPAERTDLNICILATTSGGGAWTTITDYSPEVKEAKRRGLSLLKCSQRIGKEVNYKPTIKPLAERTDLNICKDATTSIGDAWQHGSVYRSQVGEAKRRGMSLQRCSQLTGREIQTTSTSAGQLDVIPGLSDWMLCSYAVTSGPVRSWETSELVAKYVTAARNRGLSIFRCTELHDKTDTINTFDFVADAERKAAQQRAEEIERDRQANIQLARQKEEKQNRVEAERKRKIAASKKPTPPPSTSTSGSGFFVSRLGHVVTNQHVVGKCQSVTVGDSAKKQVVAEIVDTDKRNDLALLKISSTKMASADTKSLIRKLGIKVAARGVPLSSDGLLRSEDVELGERVMVSGYPYGEIFSDTIKVTGGMVSATRGMGDDSGQFQIDAAVQPGNSGGPIYDENGNIVGVVVSQLNKLKVAKVIGSLPENTNFGIKASTVRQFLTSAGLPTKWSNQSEPVSSKNLAKIAKNQTLMVVCNN
jgi:S1-C subfamily serine protease